MSLLSAGRRRVMGRQLVFEDRFDRGVLDPAKWWAEVRDEHGERLQAYTDRSTNLRIANENLIIEAHQEAYHGKTWTSASITTRGRHEFLYGRIECRMKTPVEFGYWPAFWTLGQTFWLFLDNGVAVEKGYSPGAICGEIDIMESWGKQAGSSSIAWYAPYLSTASSGFTHDRSQWNVYTLDWTPTHLGFSVNGSKPTMFNIESVAPFHIPHGLILNLAMDSNTNRSGVIDTTSGIMEVDWVRVWTMEGETVRVPQAITLGQSSITVPVGTYVWVSQSITPSNAQDQGTTWTSSNDAIARTGNGWVHGQSVGSCVVTARTWNGVQATLNVTVS